MLEENAIRLKLSEQKTGLVGIDAPNDAENVQPMLRWDSHLGREMLPWAQTAATWNFNNNAGQPDLAGDSVCVSPAVADASESFFMLTPDFRPQTLPR